LISCKREVREEKKENFARGLVLMIVQGKMCRSHARHDPEGPRTKANPAKSWRRLIQASTRQEVISRLSVDDSSKQIGNFLSYLARMFFHKISPDKLLIGEVRVLSASKF